MANGWYNPVFSGEILEEAVRPGAGTRKRARHVARLFLAKQIYTGVVFSPQTYECRTATTSAGLNLSVTRVVVPNHIVSHTEQIFQKEEYSLLNRLNELRNKFSI